MQVEMTPMEQEFAPSAPEPDTQLRSHALLKEDLIRACDIISALALDRRPSFCAILPRLHRSFGQLCCELEAYFEVEDADLFPSLSDLNAGRFPSGDVAETIRLLIHGQAALSSVLSEICEITQGFLLPSEACASYAGLLQVLTTIRTELQMEFQLENDRLFPNAIRLAEGSCPASEPRRGHQS